MNSPGCPGAIRETASSGSKDRTYRIRNPAAENPQKFELNTFFYLVSKSKKENYNKSNFFLINLLGKVFKN